MIKKQRFPFVILLYAAVFAVVLHFVDFNNVAVFNPEGMIALKERNLMIQATLLMLIIVVPVIVLTFLLAWRYRASNEKATYKPDWDYNFTLECLWWGLPCIIIIFLSVLTWKSSHELDPFKPLDSGKKPLTIQVVALQWKWLFIYPEQKIATVNYIQFPEKTPINFVLTGDSPMNSFWIPQLAGQVYTMNGMKTKLHLIADATGAYNGLSANLSGKGFAGMKFIARSTSEADFDAWVQEVKQSREQLNLLEYIKLAKPSENNPQASYVLAKEDLFDWIVMKFMMPMKEME
jgi:cytochrome o ubiquinol oxidase subunit II